MIGELGHDERTSLSLTHATSHISLHTPNIHSYTRPKYFTVPPRALKGVSPEEFVDIHLQDETTDNILDDPIQKAEIIAAIAYKPSKKKAGEAANGPTTPLEKLLDQIKTTMEKLDDDEEERPKKKAKTNSKAKKKGKKGTEDDVDLEACARAMKVYGKMKADDLKSVIRWNLGYGTTGTKNILLLKCIDGHVNGRLGRCPTCFKGKLNIVESDAGATVSCKGYFDEEIQNRIPCQYTAPATSAPRHKPWYSTEPTEEESDAIKAITEKHLSLAEGGSSDGVLPPALAAAAKKLDDDDEWDTSNRKWAAQTMVDLCTSGPTHVDLPQDEKKARMAIGKLILSNPNSTAGEILELVVKEFGIAAAKEEAKSKQKSALANSCGNAANAGIVQALQELGDLYFKDGNSNAGLTVSAWRERDDDVPACFPVFVDAIVRGRDSVGHPSFVLRFLYSIVVQEGDCRYHRPRLRDHGRQCQGTLQGQD